MMGNGRKYGVLLSSFDVLQSVNAIDALSLSFYATLCDSGPCTECIVNRHHCCANIVLYWYLYFAFYLQPLQQNAGRIAVRLPDLCLSSARSSFLCVWPNTPDTEPLPPRWPVRRLLGRLPPLPRQRWLLHVLQDQVPLHECLPWQRPLPAEWNHS